MKTKKQINHDYYLKKIKPFRKQKGVAEVPKMRCLMCGHWIEYKKLMEKMPSVKIEVKIWKFGGRANIKITGLAKIQPELEKNLREIIIYKLKTMLRALGIEFQPSLVRVESPIRYSSNERVISIQRLGSVNRIGGLR